jgi:hypothetical protein
VPRRILLGIQISGRLAGVCHELTEFTPSCLAYDGSQRSLYGRSLGRGAKFFGRCAEQGLVDVDQCPRHNISLQLSTSMYQVLCS